MHSSTNEGLSKWDSGGLGQTGAEQQRSQRLSWTPGSARGRWEEDRAATTPTSSAVWSMFRYASLSWILYNTHYIIQTMCECETGFWGALPHKHPPSTSGTGSCLCCWQPWWINTFCSPAGDASLQKNIKKITWIRQDTPDNLVSKPRFTLISNHLRSTTSSQNECIPDMLYDASSTSSFNPTGWWDFRNMSIKNNYSFIFIISCEAKGSLPRSQVNRALFLWRDKT